jgi:hypothetical protein
MRGVCLIGLVLLAGCASSRTAEQDQPAQVSWDGEGLVYATARPEPVEVENVRRADLTLVELDAAFAEKLLGIEGPSDIAPRSFHEPMGEIAAVNACYGHGRLLARPTIDLQDEPAPWRWAVEHIYLQDWMQAGEGFSPVFATLLSGVDGTISVSDSKGLVNVVVDLTSSHLAEPIQRFTTGLDEHTTVSIQIPLVNQVHRVGTETVNPGETVMFQLSRAPHEDGSRIRLLFVRLIGWSR